MKATLRFKSIYCRRLSILAAISLLMNYGGYSQSFKGKDGAETYSTAGTYILNRYTSLAGSVAAGASSFSVSNITELSGTYSFTNSINPYVSNALTNGDLVMIIKMQGADITTTDDANYGTVTNYNNTGIYEVRVVYNVIGNTIYLCQPLSNAYTQSGRSRVQVVRIPRLTNLTIGTGVTIKGLTWGGNTGGVVAIETSGDISLNGSISANGTGFRGGIDDQSVSADPNSATLFYRTTITTTSAGKGESIAGNSSDYDASLNGAYGRGAPANGGGGGNGHNAGGGGGSNAGTNGSLTPWNGTGIKSTKSASWSSAWNLEAGGFATDISTGAGRGGYTYSYGTQNVLTIAPGNILWLGNNRYNAGGFGGRPIDYNSNTRLFLGGGGGSGDGNNNAAGQGGNGGGIIYLLTKGNISGTGTITANGDDGYNTTGTNVDAAGGAGGGGAIIAMANGNISSITIQANGGKGGDQLLLTTEAEGPGGGGGGGYIATTTTSGVTRQVSGGANGVSYSTQMSSFLPNGATAGADGTIVTKTYTDVVACSSIGFILPVKLISFNAVLQDAKVNLNWLTTNEINSNHFEIEKSTDGQTFTTVALVLAKENTSEEQSYAYNDKNLSAGTDVIYYRLKMVDNDNTFTYSDIRIIHLDKQTPGNSSLAIYPNPAISEVHIMLPAAWQTKTVRFDIYDATGKLMLSAEKNMANQSEVINIKNLNTGYYILRATMGTITLQQKIIKN